MTTGSHLDEYRKHAVNSASPLQLVIMLYDGALRFMESGRRSMVASDLYRQNQDLGSAQKILAELMGCLDMSKGGEIARNLFALYTYAYNQLVEANVAGSAEPIERAAKVLSDLRGGWSELETTIRDQGTGNAHAA